MINRVKTELSSFVNLDCEENGICAQLDPTIGVDAYVVVKVDEFYNSGAGGNPTPPSIDCLITVENDDNSYINYLIELKNIKKARFNISNIRDKFKTTLYDFMGTKYQDIYENSNYRIKDMKLYFVTDPHKFADNGIIGKGMPYDKLRNLQGTKMERLLLEPPLRYRGKIYQIKPYTPDPLIIKI